MYKKTVLYFLIIVLGFSCQTVEKPQKPEPFLSKDQMLALLIDIAIVKSGKDYDLKNIREKGIVPSDYVYKKHGIDSVIYKENNVWYAANPKLYSALFSVVRDTLEARKGRIEKQIQLQDSLKNLKDSVSFSKKRADTFKTKKKAKKTNYTKVKLDKKAK